MIGQKEINTVGDAFKFVAKKLFHAGIDLANLEARLLVSKTVKTSPEQIFLFPEKEISASELKELKNSLIRRCAHEPIAYLMGEQEFWSLRFFVSSGVLIPRPESEIIVEAILNCVPEKDISYRILDLGTGSGCLLIALLSEYSSALGLGIDISKCSIEIAEKNSKINGFRKRTKFQLGDWTMDRDKFGGPFEIIVSNPPYVPSSQISALDPGIFNYEPIQSLDGGVDGLSRYREILEVGLALLSESGIIALEIGIGQADKVIDIASSLGYNLVEVRKDLASIPRVLTFKV